MVLKSEPTREDRKTCYNYKGKFVPDKHMALNMKSQGFGYSKEYS